MSQSIKVLLIEDNRIEARQTQQWLALNTDVPFAVEWVERISLGLDRLARGGIDVVLTDLNLPDSRGLETFVQLHDRAPGVPIVVLTGEDDESLGALAVERGAQDYLVKQQVNATKLGRALRFALTRHEEASRKLADEVLERRRAEEVIHDHEELKQLFQALLGFVPDAIIIMDREGQIVLVNPAAETLFGYTREELIGRPIKVLSPDCFGHPQVEDWAHYIADARVRVMGLGQDISARRKDGTEFSVEISLGPLPSKEGMRVCAVIRDVTERKRFEKALQKTNAQLENASRVKDRFLASMSHELRTPLNAILGFTGTLLMRLPGPLTADQEKQLRTVQSSGRHLLSLINDLLDLVKIENGKVELRPEPVACHAVLEEVAAALRPLADAKGLAFEVGASDPGLTIRADRRALTQILINLAGNAIKFTERGRVGLELDQCRDDGRVTTTLRVVDTGIGIRPEDQDNIFRAFEQVGPAGLKRPEGTGLGLHLSRKLAELMGGRIECLSAYGAGSTFTLVLHDE